MTVGFGGYRVDLKNSRLLRGKLKNAVHLFFVTEFTRYTTYSLGNIQAFPLITFVIQRHYILHTLIVRLNS